MTYNFLIGDLHNIVEQLWIYWIWKLVICFILQSCLTTSIMNKDEIWYTIFGNSELDKSYFWRISHTMSSMNNAAL